jgi:hypothetical protein
MKRWDDFIIELTTDDILRGQAVDPEQIAVRKPGLVAVANQVRSIGGNYTHPVAIVDEIAVLEHRHERLVLEGGRKLTGPEIGRHLAGAETVVAVLCTIGSELEETVSRLFNEDPLTALALDGYGNAVVERMAQMICERIGKKAGNEKRSASTPLSPGSPEWPVDIGQPEIFALLDAGQAGIRLTSGGMMVPRKSMSFVVGLGQNMAQTDLCEMCSLKATCRYRDV